MEYKLYRNNDSKTTCLLCPNYCSLTEGQKGLCKIRECRTGIIINPYSGILSAAHMDPIEKKPLYHFYPGSEIFSIGFFGCTLKCQFCQNFSISQNAPQTDMKPVTPDNFIKNCIENNIRMIAFTYSEPTLYFEWVLETAQLCRKNSIKTVLVTNGYLNPEPADILLPFIDALNIDLKAAKDDFYRKICKGKIEPVKEFIRKAFYHKRHIEITTLVITGLNDTISDCESITGFIAGLSPDIPFHISRYFPSYQLNAPPTEESVIKEWVETARKQLNYVYGGNVAFNGNTICKSCKKVLVSRTGYHTRLENLNELSCCNNCGTLNPFVL